MTLTIDQYAEYVAPAERVWAVVGDPRRLREWTGVDLLEPPERWEEGAQIVTGDPGPRTWTVISVGQRGVELVGDTPRGRLGIGVRVIAAGAGAAGCRVVFAARLDPSGPTLGARLRDLPSLRRRFDRWATGLRRLVDR